MHPLLRTFLAIVIGCLSAFAVVAILELAGHAMFPVTGHLDISSRAAMDLPVQIPFPRCCRCWPRGWQAPSSAELPR